MTENTIAGIDELRAAVDWANWQDEHEHDGLTAEEILTRYRQARALANSNRWRND